MIRSGIEDESREPESPDLRYVRPPRIENDHIPSDSAVTVRTADGLHLSEPGGEWLMPWIVPRLLAAGIGSL